MNGDGCDSTCKLEPGPYLCDNTKIPTICVSTEELVYEMEGIIKSEGVNFSGTIILRPRNKRLPFSVFMENFLTQNLLSHLNFKIIAE